MNYSKDFFDTWADIYDSDCEEQELNDLEFYVDLACQVDGPVLEVGCGTGRIYLELLKAGVDAYGFDISKEMLSVLDQNAAEADLTPRVRQADMTEFAPKREYALIIVPFRTFLHNITTADRKAALRNFQQALRPNGKIALDFFVPSFEAICENYGEPVTRTITQNGEEYVITYRTTIDDELRQIIRSERTIEQNGEAIREAALQLALISKTEFELLLEVTNWSNWTGYGGFNREPLESGTQEMVWIAEK